MNPTKTKFYRDCEYVVIDFKKTMVGTFNTEQLKKFLGIGLPSIVKYVQKGLRYNLFYYIFTTEGYEIWLQQEEIRKANATE